MKYKNEVKLCKYGHYDATTKNINKIGNDIFGHGTNIIRTIARSAKNKDYCIQVVKIFNDKKEFILDNNSFIIPAKFGAKIFNLSYYGKESYNQEFIVMDYLVKKYQVNFVVSAGNDGVNLDIDCNSFPACYKNLNKYVIGATLDNETRSAYSNYGSIVTNYENGYSLGMSGTSQAAAKFSAKLIP